MAGPGYDKINSEWLLQVARDWARHLRLPDPEAAAQEALAACRAIEPKFQDDMRNLDAAIKNTMDRLKREGQPSIVREPVETRSPVIAMPPVSPTTQNNELERQLVARGIDPPLGDKRTKAWRESAMEALQAWKEQPEDALP